ncbi:MAG TPA: A24 family peptidase [Bacillota bacterium]|nr:A24 family peptidase [Bacillota bacterium]
MEVLDVVKTVVLVSCLALALIDDIREHRIRNKVTIPTAVLGMGINLVEGGTGGLVEAVVGWLVPVIVLLVFYLTKLIGAGDIKLFAAIGAVMGLHFVLASFIISIWFGGAIALVLVIKRKQAGAVLSRLREYILLCMVKQGLEVYPNDSAGKFPFATAIVPATLVQLGIWVRGGNLI